MLEFRRSMDQHSRNVYANGKHICDILWHTKSTAKIVWYVDILLEISLRDVQRIVRELESQSGSLTIHENEALYG